ncbi:MAG TPA: HlyD family efflux transporter periplasmic adaptor subunit [Longimicrobium sp.]|nr:HlyD family efflux transporter periplasmic adaptor subunit [Longimicrobium sp.]
MDVARPKKSKRIRYVYGAAGVAVLAMATVALARMKPAAASVERATVWTDTVRRGEMLRQVRGPGTLIAEDIRWVPAVVPGRVERKLVLPGTTVKAGAVLVELSNPDVERQALEARRQLAAVESDLATLRSNLESQRLTQEAAVATVRAQHREAVRQARAAEGLAAQKLASDQELQKARDVAEEIAIRLSVEERRLRFLGESMRSQVAAQQGQLSILRTLAAFQQTQIESMQVRAASDGVLQELSVEPGQWVNSGTTLAKVVQPGRLKAVLRIPETQARDVAVGQAASIDTRNGIVRGRVVRIDPSVQNGSVAVDVALEGPLPRGARPDLSVDGTVDIERLTNVMYVGRPASGQAESVVSMFRLSPDGSEATRVSVKLGRGSASTVEIVSGARPGDVMILSDMSAHDGAERVRLR